MVSAATGTATATQPNLVELLFCDSWTRVSTCNMSNLQVLDEGLSDFESVFDDFSQETMKMDEYGQAKPGMKEEYSYYEAIQPGSLIEEPLLLSALKLGQFEFIPDHVQVADQAIKTKVTRRRRTATPNFKLPGFVREKLNALSGRGVYDVPETLVILMLACHYFPQKNAYAKIIATMGTPRTRNSVRRKIEKLVVRYGGNENMKIQGLIKCDEDYDCCMYLVFERYMEEIEKKIETDADVAKSRKFIGQMKSYVQTINI
mmetsp:Transcript_12748/g.15832  ORF Transcript_12748/g.15832 Transcript_12748/m.15832 type:complete len:260 (-) Transcript_12748:1087-1866(-)